MHYKSSVTKCLFAISVGAIIGCSIAIAQTAPSASLEEQLKAQYKMAKTATDSGGLAIVEPGTVLAIQKGGILGVKPSSVALCSAKFQDGSLKGPGSFCVAMVKESSRYLQVGEKVYFTRLSVNLDKDKVSVQLIECDSCNGVQDPSSYKSEVIFQFGKGALRNTSVPQVEDAIAQVLAFDQQADSQPSSNSAGMQSPAPNSQPQMTQPQTIQLGQTTEQVIASWGQPEKIVDLGSKQIYIYKDLKVTFLNGKVSDVQ